MTSAEKRIAVMGSGAVGGYFGARLAAAGENVAFIARGAHLEAMRRDGLLVKSIGGDFRARGLFTGDPRDVGPAELVLFCVKSYDTESASAAIAPIIGPRTIVLSLQNGVDNPDKLADRWGRERVLGGVVYLGAQLGAPGTITHSAGGRIVLGALDAPNGEAAKSAEAILSAAQIPCSISPEIRKVMWSKLVWNAPFCALACLARATVSDILESKSLRGLATACMEEVREAARTAGVELPPSIVEDTFNFSRGLGGFKPSMLQDLEAGKPLEYQALNGVVVDLLARAGKKAPVNDACRAVLEFLDSRIRAGR
ncbi:MAG TPA: 2-dehydropantoate 2-reductase [Candidatus Binatia bacterium]|jgi:2-dehydropantoate 2-reductase